GWRGPGSITVGLAAAGRRAATTRNSGVRKGIAQRVPDDPGSAAHAPGDIRPVTGPVHRYAGTRAAAGGGGAPAVQWPLSPATTERSSRDAESHPPVPDRRPRGPPVGGRRGR